jgi:hypothetical protein
MEIKLNWLEPGRCSRYSYYIYTTGWTSDKSWFDSLQGKDTFSFLQNVQTSPEAHTAPYSMGTEGFSPAVKRTEGGEVDKSRPPIAEANNEWSYTAISPHAFMACTGTSLH